MASACYFATTLTRWTWTRGDMTWPCRAVATGNSSFTTTTGPTRLLETVSFILCPRSLRTESASLTLRETTFEWTCGVAARLTCVPVITFMGVSGLPARAAIFCRRFSRQSWQRLRASASSMVASRLLPRCREGIGFGQLCGCYPKRMNMVSWEFLEDIWSARQNYYLFVSEGKLKVLSIFSVHFLWQLIKSS